MLDFKELSIEDIPLIKPFYNKPDNRTCDNTVGGIFVWRDYYKTRYAIVDKTLIMKVELAGKTAFTVPGGNLEHAAELICEYTRSLDIPTIICLATENDIAKLKELYDCIVCEERDLADYIYFAEDLAYMRGRKYSGQRNHINYFMKEYPDFEFRTIDSNTLPDVFKFYENYMSSVEKDSESFKAEAKMMPEVLYNINKYGFDTLALYAGGKVVAFAIGERLGDTLFEHIEKADSNVRGAYQMIASGFARTYIDGVTYVNREDDAGDMGLRKSKLSYHPCEILMKYSVKIGEKHSSSEKIGEKVSRLA